MQKFSAFIERIVDKIRGRLTNDPLYKVKCHPRPYEPPDFETYRGTYLPQNDPIIKKHSTIETTQKNKKS